MIKFLLLINIVIYNVIAKDIDFDGVSDNNDICLNTKILEIVDKNGCSKNQLKWKYLIIQDLSSTKISNDNLINYDLMILAKNNFAGIYLISGYNDFKNKRESNALVIGITKSINIKDSSNIEFNINTTFEKDDTNSFELLSTYNKLYKEFLFSIAYSISKIYNKSESYEVLSIGKLINNFFIEMTYNYKNSDNRDSMAILFKYDTYKKYYISYSNKKYYNTNLGNTNTLSIGYKF